MKAYAHQKAIIDDDPEKCGLFLGTGSGKTFLALSLAKGSILVICPKTQKEDGNWEREYKKVLMQGVEKRLKDGKQAKVLRPRLTVMSKEEFRRDWASLERFHTVIVDEAHTCLGVTPNTRQRNRQTVPKASQLFDALQSFLALTKPDRLYLCTATIVKSPMTVWGAALLLGHVQGDVLPSFFSWREKFYVRLPMPGREIYAPKKDSETKDELARLVRKIGYVGRLEEYFDVPEQTFRTVHVGLTGAQEKRIKELRLEYPDPIVLIGKRHQVENGVLAGDEFNAPEIFDNAKIDKIIEYAEEFPRMVVFVKYRAQIEQIAKALEDAGRHVIVLVGDTQDRGSVIAHANMQKEAVFICQAQISAGWELPEYPVMIFASRTYSFVDYAQALGRIQRANNIKKNLYINLVVKGGIDEAVDKALSNKQDFDERLYLKV